MGFRVYLDYNATAPLLPAALRGAEKAFQQQGNPSSAHQSAAGAKALLWSSRQSIAEFIGCHPLELIFTSGATEASNHALKAVFEGAEGARRELMVSAVEHPSVMAAAEFLAGRGVKVHVIPVSGEGLLDEGFFERHLSEKTLLVSLMMANNETGVLFPIKKLAKKARKKGALVHSDMVQVLGKKRFSLKDLGIDLASFSAHKCYALKGCGVLYCRRGLQLGSLLHGGPQERGRRAGTENLPGIASLGSLLAEEGEAILKEAEKIESLRDRLESQILLSVPGSRVLGRKARRLGGVSCIYIPEVEGETLLMSLDLKGFSVSVGSACNSGKLGSSSVLRAMGLTEKEARSCMRASLGCGVQAKDLDRFADVLKEAVERLRAINREENE